MKNILVTGKTGQLGWELARTLLPLGNVVAISSSELNLTDLPAIRHFINNLDSLAAIVHPAAYTAVDKAEDEPDLADMINATASGVLAEEAERRGIPMIYYSTDYVFNGEKSTSYLENDSVGPISVYGKTKLAGEEAVRKACSRHLILRLAWVYGARGKNFLLAMLRLAKQGIVPKVVADQHGSPSWSRGIAEVSAHVLHSVLNSPSPPSWGTYHLASAGVTTWHGFSLKIVSWAREHGYPVSDLPTAIPTSAYPTKAQRPMMSALSSDKIQRVFGVGLPSWETQLDLVLEEILNSSASI